MATFNGAVNSSSDDALQDAGTVTLTGSTPTINATNKYAGFRITNVTIPQGATVSAATLSLYFPSAANDDPDVDIWAEDTDDAATFAASSNNISSRTATTATVTWTASSVGTGWKASPDISTIIQEIVNRPGWASGNDIAIILKGRSVSPLRFEAYDGSTGNYATLDVTYTASSPQTLTGVFISSGHALYAGTVTPGAVTLTGATIAAGTTLYAGSVKFRISGATIAAGTTLYAGKANFKLTGATIAAGTTLYAGTLTGGASPQTLTGATIAAGTTLYAGQVNLEIEGATIAAGTTLYAGTMTGGSSPQTLTGETIAAGTTLYAGTMSGGAQPQALTGAFISSGHSLYAGRFDGLHLGTVTHHEAESVSSTSFYHEHPDGANLLLVIATYKDTAGVNSLAFGSNGTGNGEFSTPRGVAVAADGTIYVTDYGNDRVQYFDSAGAYIGQWGTEGSGDGEFDFPHGIAINDDGKVYVADAINHRIQKFDSDGTFVTKWGTYGTGDGQFNSPRAIAVDADGYVYVGDYGNNRIQKFDSNGVYVSQWGSSGAGDGEFASIYGIAVDPNGDIYVTDVDEVLVTQRRVQKFDSDGTYLGQWGSYGGGNGEFVIPLGVAISENGAVYVVDGSDNSRVQRFEGDGTFVTKWGTYGTGDGQFNSPNGIAVGPDGTIYVCDGGNHRVQAFSPGLKINAAYYGETQMEVGPLVDSGDYFQAFYTLAVDGPINQEVSIAAPTGPDRFLVTAISLYHAETTLTDYTAPDAGRAEQETSTTALQVSHSRTYPNYTLSVWSLLYEGATTLTPAANNTNYTTRTNGTLINSLGFRRFASSTSGSQTFGATASPAVTQKITSVIHIEASRPQLTGATIAAGTTLYAGSIALEGQPLYGVNSYITGTTLYTGQVNLKPAGATIAAGTTLYAGTVANIGTDQVLFGVFIGVGIPSAINGAYIDAATEFFAGVVTNEAELEGAYISSTEALYAGTVTSHASTATGAVYAGTISHV